MYRKPRRVSPLRRVPRRAEPVAVLVSLFRVVSMAQQKQRRSKRYLVQSHSIPLKLISIILALLRKLVMVLEVFEHGYI